MISCGNSDEHQKKSKKTQINVNNGIGMMGGGKKSKNPELIEINRVEIKYLPIHMGARLSAQQKKTVNAVITALIITF